MSSEICQSKSTLRATNRCLVGFQHGKKKMKMEDEFAEGPLGRDYGDGYRAGRELAFQQTGSKRKVKRNVRKTRRTKKLNGRK